MPKTKPPYPAEFRQQMVELAHGRSHAGGALRVSSTSAHRAITSWVAQAAADAASPCRGKDVLSTRRTRRAGATATPSTGSSSRSATSWQRLRPGSPARTARRPSGLRTREREPGQRRGAHDVPRARGLGQRLLRLARSRTRARRWTMPCSPSASARSTPIRTKPTACRAFVPS